MTEILVNKAFNANSISVLFTKLIIKIYNINTELIFKIVKLNFLFFRNFKIISLLLIPYKETKSKDKFGKVKDGKIKYKSKNKVKLHIMKNINKFILYFPFINWFHLMVRDYI